MNRLLLLDCKHTVLLRDHPWDHDLLYYCGLCGQMKVVVDYVTTQDERGPDGKH